MNEELELTGYKGKASKALKGARAEIGDLLHIENKDQTFEGILIPRSEYGDEAHIVLKLKSGYNIGVKISPETTIKRVGEGAKPSFEAPPLPTQNPKLPRVFIISTGGTIASRVDYRTGAVRPALTANDLYSVVPELTKIARIDATILFSLLSENIGPSHWSEMTNTVAKAVSEGADGIVIAHGTDTMGYTAAALSFALQNLPLPVVLVGSQRSADRPSSDAATNLIGAVKTAAEAPFAEVVIAMHESTSDDSIILLRGTKARKCHTSGRDAFKSVNTTPIARLKNGKLTMLTQDYQTRDPKKKLTTQPEFHEKVALLKFHPAIDPSIIGWHIDHKYKGIIIEGTGLGHVSSPLCEAVKNAVDQGLVVGMTSQCIWGRTNMNVYEQGRDLLAAGVIPLEDMLPETAVVKLMWILGHTDDPEEARRLLTLNIAGEISARTLPEE